jgi:integrase
LAIDSELRGCDVVAIKVEVVAPNGYTMDRATVRQKKTGRPVKFELTDQTREAVDDYLKAAGKKPGEFLFTGRRGFGQSITTRQCWHMRPIGEHVVMDQRHARQRLRPGWTSMQLDQLGAAYRHERDVGQFLDRKRQVTPVITRQVPDRDINPIGREISIPQRRGNANIGLRISGCG